MKGKFYLYNAMEKAKQHIRSSFFRDDIKYTFNNVNNFYRRFVLLYIMCSHWWGIETRHYLKY